MTKISKKREDRSTRACHSEAIYTKNRAEPKSKQQVEKLETIGDFMQVTKTHVLMRSDGGDHQRADTDSR